MKNKKKAWFSGAIMAIIIAVIVMVSLTTKDVPSTDKEIKDVAIQEENASANKNETPQPKENQDESEEATANTTEEKPTPESEENEPSQVQSKDGKTGVQAKDPKITLPISPDRTKDPFDFTFILSHPEEFKEAASKGIFYGTNLRIGNSYKIITAKYGDLKPEGSYKGGYLSLVGTAYHLNFPAEKEGSLLSIRTMNPRPVTKVETVIEDLGEPYYYHDLMDGSVNLVYLFGDYQVTMELKGSNKTEPKQDSADYKVVGIDLDSTITSFELRKTWIKAENLDKNVNYY
ncbi:hypothetical protein [Rossellomorea vietnamensis]|uniref:hypothetical protein n=1 Tax=Rossellomorea vietnamensis TaxID=218284 RepID=UPI003D26FADA